MSIDKCESCKYDKNTCTLKVDKIYLVLNITDVCNEECKFCWHILNKDMYEPKMSEERIDQIIEYVKRDFPTLYPMITFMGGEPTTNMEIVKYTVDRIRDNFQRYYFMIVTNAVVIPKELINIIETCRNFKISVSLPRKYSNLFNIRLENIKQYLELSKKYNIEFMITIQEEDFDNLYSILNFWKCEGIKKLTILTEYQKEDKIDFNESKYKEKLKLSLYEIKKLEDENFKIINFKIDNKQYILNDTLKNKRMEMAIFSDGEIYLTTRDKYFENSSLGNIYDGLDKDEYIRLLKSVPCVDCKYNEQCCYDISAFFNNNKLQNNKTFCVAQKTIIDFKNTKS